MLYLIILMGVISLILIAFLIQKNKKNNVELTTGERDILRSKLLILLRGIHDSTKEIADDFLIFNQQNSVYFNQLKLKNWQLKNQHFYTEIKSLNYKLAELNQSELALIQQFLSYFDDGENVRNQYNQQFIQHSLSLYSTFFDDIEGRKLDVQQRIAVVTDEDNNLIIAGAGSGKTTTIAGKVAYLIHRYGIKASDILLISFTKKAADEM